MAKSLFLLAALLKTYDQGINLQYYQILFFH